MAKFAYNNAKNASMGHMSFELNCSYYPQTFFKENVNPRSLSQSANELVIELRKLIERTSNMHKSFKTDITISIETL